MQLILTSLEADASTAHSVKNIKIHSHDEFGAKVDFTKLFDEM